jgi:leader peptidase (prepilin peptidase)/N-methyltransferase
MASELAGAAVGAGICLAASPYLAALTRTVPDRENARWYRPVATTRERRLATAAAALGLGALAGAAAGWSALLPALVALALAGAPLVVIDYEQHRLPNRLVYPAAIAAAALLALAAAVRHDWPDYLRAVEAGAASYAVLFVLMFISPRSFGWGDVRLGGVLGGYLGFRSWLSVYYGIFAGFVLGALVAVVLLATRRATMKTAVAFGPMLLLGALLVLVLAPHTTLLG